MSNVLENVIAGIIVAGILTLAGFLLAFGRKLYYELISKLTIFLLESALKSSSKNPNLEKHIIDIVLHNTDYKSSVIEHPNQDSCESYIKEAFSNAKKVKILTIRGQKYFLGSRSLLYDVCLTKKEKGYSIEVLVLSPNSSHITNNLAENLGHNSAERIKRNMRISLENLRHISEQNSNFHVKCYDETPNFKILLLDNVMFVSSFANGGPKNDSNIKMLEMQREGNPLFAGMERYFDDLSKRSVPLDY